MERGGRRDGGGRRGLLTRILVHDLVGGMFFLERSGLVESLLEGMLEGLVEGFIEGLGGRVD